VRLAKYFCIGFLVLALIASQPRYVRAQAGNSDADLASIYQETGSLSPAFSPSVTEYWVRMHSSVNGYYTAATPADSAASMEYSMNGGAWMNLPTYTSTGYLSTNRGDNTFQIRVTSADSTTTKTYTIHVYFPPTDDANLSDLRSDQAALTPAFQPSTANYAANVPYTTNSISFIGVLDDPAASLEINGATAADGAASGPIPLNVGSNTILSAVTSYDGTANKTYTISVTRAAPSTNSDLSSLTVPGYTLSPAFATDTTAYTVASVTYATDSLTVIPTAADPTSTIKVRVNGDGYMTVNSGSASGALALNVGSNTVEIQVTAQDGATSKDYTITVQRKNNNAALSKLTVSPGSLKETFSSERLDYSLEDVDSATDTLTVSLTPADPAGASVRVYVNDGDPMPVTDGSGIDVPLTAGSSNHITFEVTAEDPSYTKRYTISVNRLQDSTIYPTSATFDKYSANSAEGHYQDIVTALSLNGHTLSSIKLDDTPLGASSYTLSGDTITIHKEYLAALGTGYHMFTFEMNKGTSPQLSVLVRNTAPPVLESAAAGDGHVKLTWSPVDGSSGYKIYQSLTSGVYGPEAATVTGSTYGYDVTGLTNGTAYYFVVKATNPGGDSAASNEVGATPVTVPAVPDDRTVTILVNGKAEKWGLAATTRVNDRSVTAISLNPVKFSEWFATASPGTEITIPFTPQSDVVIGEFTGRMVKTLEQNQAVVKIQTDRAAYTLPARQIGIDAISNRLGPSAELQNIYVQIEIAAPTPDMLQAASNTAAKGHFELVAPPLTFMVRAVFRNTSLELSGFDAYVEHAIAIPDGIGANRAATGIAIEPDGSLSPVPTKLAVIAGNDYAIIRSSTGGTYAIVSHPVEFQDVAGHWAKSAINDLGSRMIASGIGNGRYAPDQSITRAEFAAILVRGLGLGLKKGGNAFPDVKASNWYSDAVQTAYAYQLINGYDDGAFHPMDRVTREQAMAMIARAMTLTGLKLKLPVQETNEVLAPFADAENASDWARDAIADCLLSGIVSGRTETELAPKAFMTRAETAVILQRFLEKCGLI